MIKKSKDERIVSINNKIQSEAFLIAVLLLGISIFIKGYFYDMPVSSYITELAVMVIALAYIVVRGAILGYNSLDTSKRGKYITILATFGLSLAVSIANGVRNYTSYGDRYTGIFDIHFLAVIGVSFLSSFAFISLILFIVSCIDKMGQKNLEKKIEYDEEKHDEIK